MNTLSNMNSNTLTDLQFANMKGFLNQSSLVYVLFFIFLILIIAYIIWIKKMYK